ncbi:hypothetical protein Pfo_015192 [Paulownia fortunei]|nr:hypothetical protein Pfo_015192 [Paulownia fortunei]
MTFAASARFAIPGAPQRRRSRNSLVHLSSPLPPAKLATPNTTARTSILLKGLFIASSCPKAKNPVSSWSSLKVRGMYVNPSKPKQNDEYKFAKKVIVSAGVKNDEYVVMAIDDSNKLLYIKLGDEKWSMVRDNGGSNNFLDVVNYKEQFYGIDVRGGTWVFDSIFEATKITHNIYHCASKRHLVELYNGELFLVEEVTDKDRRVCTCYNIYDGCQCRFLRTPVRNTAVGIIISKIDKREREWVDAKTVNDQIIFAGDDCSYSGTHDFYTDRYIFRTEEEKKPHYHDNYDSDYDDNCDYGYNYFECDCGDSSDDDTGRVDNFVPSVGVKLKFRGLHGHNTGVCDFETGNIGSLLMFPDYADIFWLPPSWLGCG